MKDKGLDKGLILTLDTSARNRRGQEQAFYGFRKMFWTYLNKLNVPFYDPCCVTINGGDGADAEIFPVRYSESTDGLERYNAATEAWVAFDTTPATITTNTINEQTAAAGVTVDSVLLKDGGVSNAGATMIAAFYPQVVQNNITAGTGGAIAVTNYLTTINTDAGGDAFTLANGTQIGQMKKILLVVDGGGDGVVTPATALAGGTTITFNDAADYVILQWSGTAWVVQENSGTTIA